MRALFELLRAKDLRRAYAFDYWLAPRLTFEARRGNHRGRALQRPTSPAHAALSTGRRGPRTSCSRGVETFRAWLGGDPHNASREEAVGELPRLLRLLPAA